MNKKQKYHAVGLLLFITVFFTTAPIAAEKLVFTSVEDSYLQQISEAVLKSAYEKLEIEFETSWLPAKRALVMSSSGKVDGEISRIGFIEKKHPNLIKIKIPINIVEGMAISRNKSLLINNWDSLRPFKIGVNRGTIFSVNGTMGMNVVSVNSFTSLFQMLEKDRLDVIVSPLTTGLVQIFKQDLKDIIINEPPLTRLSLYHYLHKRHFKLAVRLESVLKKMKESGEIAHIRSAYIQDLKQGIIYKRSQ